MKYITKEHAKFLVIGFAVGILLGLTIGYIVFIGNTPESKEQQIARYSYVIDGDTDKLVSPVSYAVDGDWSTKIEWNTTQLGDFSVSITENFTIPNSSTELQWELKAYHHYGGLIPTPLTFSYWNGSSWKQLYSLDDTEYTNEVFIQTLDMPSDAIQSTNVSVKTVIEYSSHTAGGVPPNPPQQLSHYVEYFEGKLTMTKA